MKVSEYMKVCIKHMRMRKEKKDFYRELTYEKLDEMKAQKKEKDPLETEVPGQMRLW